MKKKDKRTAKKQLKKHWKQQELEKLQAVREILGEINYHAEQVGISLRHLANAIDNARSYHLSEEQPATAQRYKEALKGK